jgi:glycosyltransferase involved in cell wall biosynthesis
VLHHRADRHRAEEGPSDGARSSPRGLFPGASRVADVGDMLLASGALDAAALRAARREAAAAGLPLATLLERTCAVAPAALAAAIARTSGLPMVDPARTPPDARLIDSLGAAFCLAHAVAPLPRRGSVTPVAVADPATLPELAPHFDRALGRWTPAVAPRAAILAAVAAARARPLACRAAARSPVSESCRHWSVLRMRAALPVVAMLLVLALMVAPVAVLTVLTLWAIVTLVAVVVLRAAALWFALRRPAEPPDPPLDRLPTITVIVALYREAGIAPRLVRRLGRLDYPRALLDVILAVEDDDAETRAALDAVALPPWLRVVVVPPGAVRTKPRALNYALDFARGSIVGTWDAEDAPAPDQLRIVAARFAARPPEVACLQGVLDYYNPRTNWIARCFTVEYAAWFRVVLPGLQRLGAPLPLGGTTLFLRRTALEQVGAWDAHNVTEDADLGIRLYRRGYRTEMIPTVTEEEANCRPRAWVRQRSRWIKGHLITWAVHMRHPLRLWRDLGGRGFLLYQILFLGGQSQVLLAPLLLSLWVLAAGVPHPVAAALGGPVVLALTVLFVGAEALTVATGIVGARRTRHRGLAWWAPTLHLYYPLASLAGWRAAVEVFTRPFYWAKTSHGHFDSVLPAQRVRTSPASMRSRVSKARLMWVRSAS